MNAVREYRVPLFIGAGTVVIALLLWVVLVSPQNSKLSSLQAQQTQLQTQQTSLTTKLASLKTEQQKVSTNCADLQKISTQIPSVQSPTDIDAEESSFESQFNGLAASTGVTLTQFSGFAPATTTSGTPAATTTPAGSTGSVVAVPTTLAVTGSYGQMLAFVNGLESFPRLFVIQKFVLSFGGPRAPGAPAVRPARVGLLLQGPPRSGPAVRNLGRRRAIRSGHHRVDLLHHDPECPGRLRQGHHRRCQVAPASRAPQTPLICISLTARVWPAAIPGSHSTSAPTATKDWSIRCSVDATVISRIGSASLPLRIIRPSAPTEKSPLIGFTPEWTPVIDWTKRPSPTAASTPSSSYPSVPGASVSARHPGPGVPANPPLTAEPVEDTPAREADTVS